MHNRHDTLRTPTQRSILALAICCTTIVGCQSTPNPVFTFAPQKSDVIVADWNFDGHKGVHMVSDNYDIFTTSLDQGLQSYLPEFLETTLEFYKSIITSPSDTNAPSERMKTYLFDDREQWETFTRRQSPGEFQLLRKISHGGYSKGADSVAYDIGRSTTLSLLAHEGMHQYLATRFDAKIPAWINEGLASYCECVEFADDKPRFTPGRNTFRINHLRSAVKHGPTYTMTELLSTNAGAVIDGDDGNRTTSYYAHVWALVLYLRHGENGKNAASFQSLLDGIADGTFRIRMQSAKVASKEPSAVSNGEAAFRAYITTDLSDFEIGFKEFVYNLCYPRDPVRIDIGWEDRLLLE